MANKQSIEEQVAALTPEQKAKILKIGKVADIVTVVGSVPLLAWALIGLFAMIQDPLIATDGYMIGWGITLALVFVWVLAVNLFVKVAYPFYSVDKFKYIAKQVKEGKPL